MSRSLDRDDHERERLEAQSRMPLSQGRGGGGASTTELASVIDTAAVDKPTMTEFVERLATRGVDTIPSIQSSGRLNGLSYRFQGRIVKGSSVGRAYTAQGVQQRLGVRYEPSRDDSALARALERAGVRGLRAENRRCDAGGERAPRVRDRVSGLSTDQRDTLAEVGRFRTVSSDDLVRYRYSGNSGSFRQDIRVLSERGLAKERTVRHVRSGREYRVVVLTRQGRNALRKSSASRDDGQQYYAGFVKPAEVRHDVGLYRMYQVEAARIEGEGGAVRRVTLDFEFKKQVFTELNKGGRYGGDDYEARKHEVAEQHGLKVVDGHVKFPDLRIEYKSRDQELDKVDLELATGDYKARQMRAKHVAGFKIYAPDSAAGSPAMQDPEIVAELISL